MECFRVLPYNNSDQTWTLENALVRCTIALQHGALVWHGGGRAAGGLAFAPAPLAQLALAGHAPQWARCEAATETETAHGRALTLTVADADATLRLAVTLELFNDQPFVRTSATLANSGTQPHTVTGCDILHLAVAEPALTLFHVEQFSWRYRNDFFSQHQIEMVAGRAPLEVRMGSFPSHYGAPTSCGWFAVRRGQPDRADALPHADAGLVAGIEFNGKSRLFASATPERARLRSQIDDLAHTLAPGASFALPAAFVGLFQGDWDEAGYATQRFAEVYVHPPMPDARYPWVQYNSWKYGQDINEAQQLTVIERCAALGIEVFVVDLGWARQIGDWRPDPAKFPRGLRPLADRARARGMHFGVHMALAQMHPDAPAAAEHPEWLIHSGDDYFGAGPICLGHAPCRDWLTGEILRLIDDEGIDYIIQDGEDMVKHCARADHTHAPGDSNYAGSVLGLDMVIETIRRERPQIVLENCEDGGCMLTYRMARLYHTSITVDNIASYATRQGVYGASYPFSPRYSVRYMQDDPTPYTLRSAIFGGPLILMQRLTDWNDAQMADAHAAIAQYKQLRTLIRDARIVHLLPPRANVDGLGWGWDAIASIAPDQQRGVALIYRAQGGPEQHTLRLRGLHAETRYRVTFADSDTVIEHSGAALATTGIAVALDPFSAELLTISAVA